MKSHSHVNQPIWVEVDRGSHREYWHPDPKVRADLINVLRSIAAQNGQDPSKIVDPVDELKRLEDLDAQIQDDAECAQALEWILTTRAHKEG